MPENIGYQFNRLYAAPIETYRQVNTITNRNAIPPEIRWEGMECYVVSENQDYQLVGGVDNSNWLNAGETVSNPTTHFKGFFNATTVTPAISNLNGIEGDEYKVTNGGVNVDFGAGDVFLETDDIIIFYQSEWRVKVSPVSSKYFVDVRDYGAVCDGVTDDTSALEAAILFAKTNNGVLFIPDSMNIESNVVIDVPLFDTEALMFNTDADVTIDNGNYVRPEWFGSTAGATRAAVNALPSSGGTVKFMNKRYTSPYFVNHVSPVANVNYLNKDNVKFEGEKRPVYKSDETGLEDGSGTIFSGSFCAWANNFTIESIGVDAGSNQVSILGSANNNNALCLAPPSTATGSKKKNGRIIDCIAIGTTTYSGHGILLEGYIGGEMHNCDSKLNMHGIVIKSEFVNASNLVTSGSIYTNYIFKSDQYGDCNGLNINNIQANDHSVAIPEYGIHLLAGADYMSDINISNVRIVSKAEKGIILESDSPEYLYGININNVFIDESDIGIYVDSGLESRYININNVFLKNCGVGYEETINTKNVILSNIITHNIPVCFKIQSNTVINSINVDDYATPTVFQYASTARPCIGLVRYGNALFSNILIPSFLNGWTNYSGVDPTLSIRQLNGKVVIDGVIKRGTSNVAFNIPVNYRPSKNIESIVLASNGACKCNISTNGNVTLTPFTSGESWVSFVCLEYIL